MKKIIFIVVTLAILTVVLANGFKSSIDSKITARNEAISEAISLIK